MTDHTLLTKTISTWANKSPLKWFLDNSVTINLFHTSYIRTKMYTRQHHTTTHNIMQMARGMGSSAVILNDALHPIS